jgi:hypothetical protein
VDIVLLNSSSPQTISLHPDDTGLVFNSITVQGGSYTLQGPAKNAALLLTLAGDAKLDTQSGSSLAICPDRLSSSDANSLSLQLLGSTTKTGTGTLLLNNDIFVYAGAAPTLQPLHISGGIVTLGSFANMFQSLVRLDSGTQLVVSDQFKPTVGSLTGTGTVQVGVNAGQADNTGLFIFTPQGESDVFNGVIDGQGGTIYMTGSGSITLGSVNPGGTGLFRLSIASGTLLANGVVNAQQLLVLSGATFGGLATMNFSGTVQFFSGTTFAAVANGTASGQFTHLTDTDVSDPNPVILSGTTLSLSLGYVPSRGDSYTIVSAAFGISGQFANASNGQTFTVSGVQYRVDAPGTSVSLEIPLFTATHLVVTSPPPSTVTAGTPFGLTVEAEDDSGNVDANYNRVVTITASPGGTTFTTTASQGVATFSGLILSSAGTYTFQATAGGLTPAATNPFNVTTNVSALPPPEIQSESVLFTQKTNRKGKKVGPRVFQGFVLDYNSNMRGSAANPANYQITMAVRKRVKRKLVTVYQPVAFRLLYNAATNAVSLLMPGQKFLMGGRITVIASPPSGVSSASSAFLDGNGDGIGGDNAVLIISAKAKGIAHA